MHDQRSRSTDALTTQRVAEMKFGTQITRGGTRFRLWAPKSASVDLLLGTGGATVPMTARPRGWFEIELEGVGAGTLYRFRLADGREVPDPASRFQPQGVEGPSQVVDPRRFAWTDTGWVGRPWHEAVLYELHLGTFTPEGTFAAAAQKLDYLAALGVTAIELMPVNSFPGRWGWGYDGVLPFAPDASYGAPDDLKAFVDAAHARGLMVLLDVVYNHFGPRGNFLPAYAPLLTEAHHTPWGAAMNFDGPGSEMVRDFFVDNARYWLVEYHFDGLRFDAVHEIKDEGYNHFLHDLALLVRASTDGRHTHLVLENEENDPAWLQRTGDLRAGLYDAQWNDDVHHLIEVALHGEHSSYARDYVEHPEWLPRALATGFGFQGDPVPSRDGKPKGGPSADLPPIAFVSFIQNHDQIGNRLFGERASQLAERRQLRTVAALYLLSPHIPLLFMGEEWGADTPFLFFSDVGGDLADAIRQSRSEMLGEFVLPSKQGMEAPDPMAQSTFEASKLDWSEPAKPGYSDWLSFYRDILAVRHREIVPRLEGVGGRAGDYRVLANGAFAVEWQLAGGAKLLLDANLTDEPVAGFDLARPGRRLWLEGGASGTQLDPWTVLWRLDQKDAEA